MNTTAILIIACLVAAGAAVLAGALVLALIRGGRGPETDPQEAESPMTWDEYVQRRDTADKGRL